MKLIIIIGILLWSSIGIAAADLPNKGIEPPTVTNGPDDHAPNPPIGNGLAVVAIFGVLYAIKKHKKELD